MNSHAPQQLNSYDGARREGSRRASLSDEVIESIASWLNVIAEPSRIRLIETLNRGGATAQGLAAQLRMTRSNVCRHLGVLHQAGVVKRRRVKNRVEYELNDWSGWWMIEQVGAAIAAAPDRRSAKTCEFGITELQSLS
jgi:DNA-binding transcriptional ArsR family regulator